eukprot:TRINITY_DN12971_c0_g1_i1.p1 TRINITY_DN12971_c0_g1~~TRINITY_DN12971_c0_g1_i1.p1  ORF type:complete len:111 (+),score=13.67 TRINITY_DN12971_c0_g1_i1:23-355(+)
MQVVQDAIGVTCCNGVGRVIIWMYKAVLHRVRLPPSNWSTASGLRDQPVVERQSNILFLQPSTKTVVKPLAPFLAGNASDMQAIRYGEWHFKKASLAYDLGGPNRKNQRF